MNTQDVHVLVVDDSSSAREMIKNALKDLGFTRIMEASDGDQAVDLIMQNTDESARFGMVIADLKMPNLDGLQLLNFIRKSSPCPELPFFLCTAEGEKSAVLDAVRAGADGYILKSVSYKNLGNRILQVWASYRERKAKSSWQN